jgi:succinoglycan biosynthesis transport protein ExoP
VIDDDRSVSAVADKLRTIAGGGARTLVVGLDRSTDTTSAAIGLARELASQASVVVIELGLTAPKLAGYSSDPAAPGIIDLIRGSMPFGQIIARDSMSRVHLIAAGRVDAEAAAVLESDRLGIALDALSRTYQHVIIDVGTIYDIPTARLAQLGTCAVLVAVVGAEVSVNRACESLRAAGFVEPIVMSAPSHRDVLSSPAAAA